MLYPARVHGLKSIIMAGHGASITSEALRWCAREGVPLYLMERFMRWRGLEMRFKDDAPQHWRTFIARAGTMLSGRGGMSRARYAATPMGAMLNYAYIVTLGQVTRAAISMGLDACHGFLHSPKRGRLSLSYDLMEFHRTAITERVFEIAGKRTWQQSDFELDPLGIVRLTSDLAREIAATALRITPA